MPSCAFLVDGTDVCAGIAILRADIKPTLSVCGLTKIATFSSPVVGEGGDLLGTGEGADTDAPSQEEEVCMRTNIRTISCLQLK